MAASVGIIISSLVFILLYVFPAVFGSYQILLYGMYDNDLPMHHPRRVAFRRGIIRYNIRSNDTDLVFYLMGVIQTLQINNSYDLTSFICEALNQEYMMIAGDAHPSSIHNAAFGSNEVRIPYLVTGLAPQDIYPDLTSPYLFSMQPQILEPLKDYITFFHWDSFAYIYEGQAGFLRMINFMDMIRSTGAVVTHRRIDVDFANETLAELKDAGHHRIICDLGFDLTRQVLKQSTEMEMDTASFHLIYLNLDFSIIDTSNMSFGGMNLTGFALPTNKSSEDYREIFGDWGTRFRDSHHSLADVEVGYQAILSYEVIHVVVDAARRMQESKRTMPLPSAYARTCWATDDKYNIITRPSRFGPKLRDFIRTTAINQFSGRIQFDENGARTNYSLQIMGINDGNVQQVGTWRQKETPRITFFDSDTYGRMSSAGNINRTFIITSVEEPPFLMLKKNADELEGNDRYEGYCVRLLEEIVKKFPFKYRIKLVKDNQYGKMMANGKWNGMIGELMYGSADIAVAPLTITTDRERVVAFTKPYMSFGISIMVQKPKPTKETAFSFFQPFSYEIWICLALATCGVSLIMFQVCRFSTTEWRVDAENSNGHDDKSISGGIPGANRGVKWTNDFGVVNSFWFALGALMQQGSDILPRSMSGRIMGGVWWFFTLIVISSYTANLAAFLTTQSMMSPIKSADDLAAQTKIQYGVRKGGSTLGFFKKSNVALYRKMYSFMSNTEPSPLAETTEDGVRRVRESDGKYAYLLESKMNEYVSTQKPCDTIPVGDPLGTSSYGIAVSKHLVDLNKQLTVVILSLREEAILQHLEEYYWVKASQCPSSKTDSGATRELTLDKLAGVFYILLAGSAVAVLVSVVELLYRSKKKGYMGTCGVRRIMLNVRARLAHERLVRSLRQRSRPAKKSPTDRDGSSDLSEELSTPATTQKSIVPSIGSEEGHVDPSLCKKKSGSQGSAVTHTDV